MTRRRLDIRGTRRAICILLALLAVVGPAFAEANETALARRWARAYQQQQWDQAITIGLELVEIAPEDPRHPYNLACAFARSGDVDRALEWLDRAADRGFSYPTTLRTDPDLDPLRSRPAYQAIRERVLANHERDFEQFKAEAANVTPLVILPPRHDPDKPAPLIVALHGWGGRARGMATVWRQPAARVGAILVAPQSLIESGPGYRWGKVEEAEFIVEHAIDHVSKRHRVDASRIVITGFSQGGYLSFLLGVKQRERLAGAIPVGAYADEAVPIPDETADGEARFFIMIGADDPAVDGSRRSARELKAAGFDVELVVYPGVGHAFPPKRERELDRALAFVLEGSAESQDQITEEP